MRVNGFTLKEKIQRITLTQSKSFTFLIWKLNKNGIKCIIRQFSL